MKKWWSSNCQYCCKTEYKQTHRPTGYYRLQRHGKVIISKTTLLRVFLCFSTRRLLTVNLIHFWQIKSSRGQITIQWKVSKGSAAAQLKDTLASPPTLILLHLVLFLGVYQSQTLLGASFICLFPCSGSLIQIKKVFRGCLSHAPKRRKINREVPTLRKGFCFRTGKRDCILTQCHHGLFAQQHEFLCQISLISPSCCH